MKFAFLAVVLGLTGCAEFRPYEAHPLPPNEIVIATIAGTPNVSEQNVAYEEMDRTCVELGFVIVGEGKAPEQRYFYDFQCVPPSFNVSPPTGIVIVQQPVYYGYGWHHHRVFRRWHR